MIHADKLFTNATIVTLDGKGTLGGSMAIHNGRITAIWKEKKPPVGVLFHSKDIENIDLDDRTLLPGFIDTHNHILLYAQYKQQVNCTSPLNKDIVAIQARMRDFLKTRKNGEWLVGYGYDDTLLTENRHPNREDLDAISQEHPIFIRHISGHLAVVNSIALKLAGIDENTPKPSGGHIGKDAEGNLTGVLYEPAAVNLVFDRIPTPDEDTLVESLKEASVDYVAQGITTNTDAGLGLIFGETELGLHMRAINERANPMKMRFMVMNQMLKGNGKFASYTAKELDTELQDKSGGRAKLDSAKLFQDGSIQGLTGALREPYYCDNQLFGDLIVEQMELNELALELHDRGYRLATHGNGDRAIESVIEAYKFALENGDKREGHSHRIEHVQTATFEDLEMMAKSDIAASFFINHIYYWGDRHRDIFLGPDRAKRMNPLKDAKELNLDFTLHSDCPITPISPLFSVWAAVNRITRDGKILGKEQRIDVETALKSMTIYGAKLNFEEEDTGSIEVGKAADLIVLDRNPLTINPMEIKDIHVEKTFIDGELIYEKLDKI